MNLKKISSALTGMGSAITGVFILSNLIYKVEPGERALIFNRFGNKGVSKDVVSEGYHIYIPFIQEIIKYDVKIQPFDYYSFTGTKDMQKVELKIKIFYKFAH